MKKHFARYGIPDKLHSDNSLFNSMGFHHSANKYAFELVTCSPNYAQSNGNFENSSRTAKELTKKVRSDGSDPLPSHANMLKLS